MSTPRRSKVEETRKSVLAEDLLRRGARTPTVHRLTSLPEITVRRLHKNLFGVGPTRGPTIYSYQWFLESPRRQFVSSVAAGVIRHFLHDIWMEQQPKKVSVTADGVSTACHEMARAPGELRPVSPNLNRALLGEVYVQAFDYFETVIRQWKHYSNDLDFERFASLGSFMQRGNPLVYMSCGRCTFTFVGLLHPDDGVHQSTCPACLIKQGRECAHCGEYVPQDFGDFPPQRSPACIKCACAEERISTLEYFLASRSIYRTPKCEEYVPIARAIVDRYRCLCGVHNGVSLHTTDVEEADMDLLSVSG